MPPLPNPAAVGHTGDATVAVSTWFGGRLGLRSEPESGGSSARTAQGGLEGGKSLRHRSWHGARSKAVLDAGSVLSSAARPLHRGRGRGRGLCRAFADLAVPPADHRRREQRQLRRVVPERGAQRELDVGRGQQLRGRRAHAARRLVRRQPLRLEPVTTRTDRLAPTTCLPCAGARRHSRARGGLVCAQGLSRRARLARVRRLDALHGQRARGGVPLRRRARAAAVARRHVLELCARRVAAARQARAAAY